MDEEGVDEEESEEEDEEEEEEVEEEEEEEEDSEEEEDVNGDRVDFAVQTSMLDSPLSPAPQPSRFRGQRLSNAGSFSQSGPSTPSQNNNYSASSPTYPIMSPYLRKSIKKNHGSLNEALSTLPKSKSSSQAPSPSPSSTSQTGSGANSVTSQASPKNSHNSSYNTSYSRDAEGPCSTVLVSSLIISLAAVFFLVVGLQYLSLAPPPAASVIAVCGGAAGEVPGSTCVPASQLNDTVQLYKVIRAALPAQTACAQSKQYSETQLAEIILENVDSAKFWRQFGSLVILLRQNQSR